MITKLRIQNFKSLKDTGSLPIRPLTFLVGPNSSGKSSVLQSLLMLKQTIESKDTTTRLRSSGYYTPNLGTYPEFVFEHKANNLLTISFSFRPPLIPPKSIREPLELKDLDNISVKAIFGYNKKVAQIYLQNAEFELLPYKMTFNKLNGKARYKVSLIRNGVEELGLSGLNVLKFYDVLVPTLSLRRKIKESHWDLTNIFSFEIDYLFERRVYYIGPLREWPRRFYPASGETPGDVGLRGEKAIDVLRMIRGKKGRELRAKVNYWLKEFGFAEKTKVRQAMENYYQMLVTPFPEQPKLEVNIADIGFGASQVLPIVVEGFYADPGSTLLIEQPEIHLHPKAQADLGDLFIDIAKENKVLIVETHSEYLLSRIRRRIAQGEIKREDVATYFFTLEGGRTHIQEIQINELGQFEFEQWPEDFFAEGFKEASAHFKAIAKAGQTL